MGVRSGTEGTDGVAVVKDYRTIPVLVSELRCKKHPRMRGLRRPRNRCERCLAIYEFAQRTGVREKRNPRKVVVETVTQ